LINKKKESDAGLTFFEKQRETIQSNCVKDLIKNYMNKEKVS